MGLGKPKNYYLEASLSATYNCLVRFLGSGIIGPNFLKMNLERLFQWMDCAIEQWLMHFCGQNWKIWMWTMFISNKTALRATQVAKSLVVRSTCIGKFHQKSMVLQTLPWRPYGWYCFSLLMENLPLLNEIKIKWFFTKNTRFSYKSKWNLIGKPCKFFNQQHCKKILNF